MAIRAANRSGAQRGIIPFYCAGRKLDAEQSLPGGPIHKIPKFYRPANRGGQFGRKANWVGFDTAFGFLELNQSAARARAAAVY